ncbi:MAG: hypothetical protein P8Y34_03805 [Anaerolineales bacterium]
MLPPREVIISAHQKLTKLLRYIVIDITLTYVLAAVFYADAFHFWQHALSELGTTVTLLGTPNLAAMIVITIGMFISGRLLLEAANLYRDNPQFTKSSVKRILFSIASLGSFIIIFPNNLFHAIHSIGSALLIGSVFFIDLLILREQGSSHKSLAIQLAAGILWMTVLAYAVTYAAGLEIKQAIQKICVINLLVIFYERSCNTQIISNLSIRPQLT